MFDSVELAEQIIQHGIDDLENAVAAYEKTMFPRARSLIERSKQSGEFMFEENAPLGWLQWMQSQEKQEEGH